MILAIDAGFRSTGWTIFENKKPIACGVISTQKAPKKTKVRVADDEAQRCATITRGLMDIVDNDQYKIKGVVVELPSGGSQSAISMRQMGKITGVLVAFCIVKNIPYEVVTPQEVKKVMTGRNAATK